MALEKIRKNIFWVIGNLIIPLDRARRFILGHEWNVCNRSLEESPLKLLESAANFTYVPETLFWSTCQLSHLFLLLLLKLYEGKTFLHLSHHMFTETNIVPTAKVSKTKLSLVVLHVFQLQREWIRRLVQQTYVKNVQTQYSNHKVRFYQRVSKNESRFHWFPVICKSLISPCLFSRTKIQSNLESKFFPGLQTLIFEDIIWIA